MLRNLLVLFLLAGIIRMAYAGGMCLLLGSDGLMGMDSHGYLLAAQYLAGGGSVFHPGADGVFYFSSDMMPVTFWLLSATLGGATDANIIPFIVIQGWIDAGTCVVIALLAEHLRKGLLMVAGVVAALNPTQIVLAGLLYTDTIFLFFAALSLLFSVRWIDRSSLGMTLLLGAALALATLTRPFILVWIVLLPVFLIIARALLKRLLLSDFAKLAMVLVVVAAGLSPIIQRNMTYFDTPRLSSQAGAHLLFWVVPLVTEYSLGTPREETITRIRTDHYDITNVQQGTNFEWSDKLAALAMDELRELGPGRIALAWMSGATLNLGSPAALLSPALSEMPRSSFYESQGSNILSKIASFLFSNENPVYAAAILISGLTMPVWLALGLLGLYAMMRQDRRMLVMAGIAILWIGYILGLNGPVASPKYRLPIEPMWVVLFAMGAVQAKKMLLSRLPGRAG